MSEICIQLSDRNHREHHPSDIKALMGGRIQAVPDVVWTPVDFLDLGLVRSRV
jgi:hypothetical protein